MKINTLIVNLIRNELDIEFLNYSTYNDLSEHEIVQNKISCIPTSNICLAELENIASSIGISVNMLTTQILGEYARNHTDYQVTSL